MAKGRILSGMRPTGMLHLGHLVGVLDNWKILQDDYECLFVIVDWHALMSEYKEPQKIKETVRSYVADWIACGIDPERSTIFLQSDVPEHTELHLILSAITPLPWVERCPTFKEQLNELKSKDIYTYAFLGYPVLQVADILLYKADTVPVGEDQLPHLELGREIARRFQNFYGDVFVEPQAKLTKASRLLGLDRRKMSNSYDNFIALGEEPDVIRRKIEGMYTDPQRVKRSDPGRPDFCNVHSYFEIFAADRAPVVADGCRNATIGCRDCKREIAEALVERLTDVREKRKELLSAPEKIQEILDRGAQKASKIAKSTMSEVREAMGMFRKN